MNLYELTKDWEGIYQMLDNPDIPEDAIMDSIEGIEGIMDIKIESMAKFVRIFDGDISIIDSEIERLKELRDSKKNRRSWLLKSIMDMMKATARPKIKTALFSFSIQKNGGKLPIIIKPGCDVPPEWLKPGDPDTTRIRKHLEEGHELDFATFGERSEHLNIR